MMLYPHLSSKQKELDTKIHLLALYTAALSCTSNSFIQLGFSPSHAHELKSLIQPVEAALDAKLAELLLETKDPE